MTYEEIFKTIISSTDFNRGFLVGVIDTVKALYGIEVDSVIVKSLIDTDFGFDDVNMLKDYVLQSIEEEENIDGDN